MEIVLRENCAQGGNQCLKYFAAFGNQFVHSVEIESRSYIVVVIVV